MAGSMRTIQGDITRLQVEAIVNAANEALLPGGGVCGAVHRAAGPELWQECRLIGHCDPGEAVITHGYNLPAAWVIHTVGPVWEGGRHGEDEVLARCYANSLKLAAENGVRSIAFPAISTGIYGFPVERATPIAVETVRGTLTSLPGIEEVIFACFDEDTYRTYQQALQSAGSTRTRP